MLVRRHLVALAALVVCATGCVGSINRSEFDTEVRSRGGGIAATWILGALDQTAIALGVPEWEAIEVLDLTIDPRTRSVTTSARRGDDPGLVDTAVALQDAAMSVTAQRDVDPTSLAERTVRLGDLPIDDIESLADEALRAFGEPTGYIANVMITGRSGTPAITMSLSADRRTDMVTFDRSGTRIGGDR